MALKKQAIPLYIEHLKQARNCIRVDHPHLCQRQAYSIDPRGSVQVLGAKITIKFDFRI
jgi:hypothetical protein